jgi:hypothetical protein
LDKECQNGSGISIVVLILATRECVDRSFERPTMAKGYSSVDKRSDKFNDEKKHNKFGARGNSGFNAVSDKYDGYAARRTQEMQDGGMIREDMRSIANLPQEVMIKPYPKTGPYLPEGLNDDISGIDKQMDFDDSQRRAHFFPKKV